MRKPARYLTSVHISNVSLTPLRTRTKFADLKMHLKVVDTVNVVTKLCEAQAVPTHSC